MLLSSARSSAHTLSGRSLLKGDSALTIANKLEAEISEGRKHTKALVRIRGTYIGMFGIRRDKNVGHDYIPRQIHVTTKQALALARCSLYKADYERILKDQGKLPPAPAAAKNAARKKSSPSRRTKR